MNDLSPWADAPDWAIWRAKDRNGQYYYYQRMPTRGTYFWSAEGLIQTSKYVNMMVDWTQSLERNPQMSEIEQASDLTPDARVFERNPQMPEIEQAPDLTPDERMFQRNINLAASIARLHAINTYVAGMNTSNVICSHRGEPLAYDEYSFAERAQQLENLAEQMEKI